MTPVAVVLWKLAAIAAPFLLLAWLGRIYPRRTLLLLALVPALLSLGLLIDGGGIAPILAADGLLALVALSDVLSLPASRAFGVEREAGRVASLRKPHPVALTLLNLRRRRFAVDVRDGVPHDLHPEPEEFAILLQGRSRATLRYVLRPGRRGAFTLGEVHVRARSRLGLWQRLFVYPLETAVHVYPDVKQLSQYAVLARTNRLRQLGVRRTRRIGQDHDFERLRDYTVDDNYKHIDWRTTARRRKLTVRDYQASQSQRLLFLVDCGRMMTNESQGLSLLDHSLNAALLLSYVALRQGDSVGLLCFSDRIHSYLPARGGMRQMNHLLHASFDRFARLVESRYDEAFLYLASQCRKRSLVVLITNLIDEVNANQVERHLNNLTGRHLPLAVLLRDHRLFDAVDVEHPVGDAFWQAAAAAEILTWRHQVLTDLRSRGVLLLDVFAEQMTAPLVNRYLEIKARHLL